MQLTAEMRRQQRSGSSQRRGVYNTQNELKHKYERNRNQRLCQEKTNEDSIHSRVDLTAVLRLTNERRRRKKQCSRSRNQPAQKATVLGCSANNRSVAEKGESKHPDVLRVKKVLESVMRSYGRNTTDMNITEIILEYSDWERHWIRILQLRNDAVRLKKRLESRQDRPTVRMIIGKTLNSKSKQLIETQGSHPGTPETSDSEEEEEPLMVLADTRSCILLSSDDEDDYLEITQQPKPSIVLKVIEKADVNTTRVDAAPKYLSKKSKAYKVTTCEDKALKPHEEKNIKTTKNLKEGEEAEQEENEAQPQAKQAAYPSTPYLSQTAAEVYFQRLQHTTPETTTIPNAHPRSRTNPGPTTLSCDIEDFEHSRSPVSWSKVTRSNESRTLVSKKVTGNPAVENQYLCERWKHESIKGGMEKPQEPTLTTPIQKRLQMAASQVEITKKETRFQMFEKITSPVVNSIKKGIKRKKMTPHRNLMQPAEERPTKIQAAVKEVASTQRTQSTNIEKMKSKTAPSATSALAGCPNEDNITSTDSPTSQISKTKNSPTSNSPDLCSTRRMDTSHQESSKQNSETPTPKESPIPKAKPDAKNEGKGRKANWEQEAAPSWIYNIGERYYHKGLKNLDNTCWLNSILQCLIRSHSFLEVFLRPRKGRIFSLPVASILWFISKMTETDSKNTEEVYNPQTLLNELAKFPNCGIFLSKRQQDPTEMLFWIHQHMDTYPQRMSKDGKCTMGHNDIVLKEAADLMSGKMRQSIVCTKCNNTTVKDEPFTLLPICLGSALNTPKTVSTETKNTRARNVSIEDLLSRIAYPELLEEDNKFDCTTCKEKVMAGKSHTISSLPKLLILHLKRFSKENGTAAKRTDHVRFNSMLQLEKTSLMRKTVPGYILKGVIVHNGNDAESGHYIAYVLHGDEWLSCSDNNVTKVQWATVKAKQAYVLFYEQDDPTNPLLQPRKKKKRLSKPKVSTKEMQQSLVKADSNEKSNLAAGENETKENHQSGWTVNERSNEKTEVTALRDTIKNLITRVERLEHKVIMLQNDKLRLKLDVEEIRRKARMDEEEAAAYRTGDDMLMRAAERKSPTPVMDKERIPNEAYRSRKTGHESRHREERTERRYRGDTTRQRKSVESEDDARMDIDSREPEKTPKPEESRYTEQAKIRKEHRKYLEKCYERQIRLPLDEKQDISIFSFTEHRVARGYQKVVTTCQGMYYELTKEQVVWRTVPMRSVTIGGDECWRGEGVSVYRPTSRRDARPIVRHRFAINLSYKVPRTQLKTDRYYIHVYQTKIGPERRTLRSREMVQEMKERFRGVYWPRLVDTQGRQRERNITEERNNIRRRNDQRADYHRGTEHQRGRAHQLRSTQARSPRREPRRVSKPPQFQDLMTGLQKLTEAVERLVENGRRA